VADAVGADDHPSPILPVVIGGETEAVAASASLLDQGLWVPAIRPPTVAPGTSRLRVTLSATHTDAQVDRLLDGLAGLLPGRSGAGAGRGPEVGSAA
jgi:7-keto-8-aminopelargonate synthetase-like enzyme